MRIACRPRLRLLLCLLSVVVAALFAPAAVCETVPSLAEIRALRAAGRLAEALAATRRAREVAPLDVDLALFEGLLLSALGEHGAAVRVLTEALPRAPDYADLRMALARALAAQGHERQALDLLAPLAANPSLESLLLTARLALAAGALEQAATAIARARRIAPEDPRLWLLEGDRLAAEGRIELARVYFERILQAGGSDAELARSRLAGLPDSRRFALTVAGTTSRFRDASQQPWYEADVTLEWSADARTTLRARLSERRRFAKYDTVFGLGADRRWSDWVFAIDLQATPAADFSPSFGLRLAIEKRLMQGGSVLGATSGRVEGRLSRYGSGTVTGAGFALTQYTAGGGAWVTLGLGIDHDETGNLEPSFSGRVDLMASERVRLFAGSAYARDGTDDGTVAERTLFVGSVLDLSDSQRLFIDLAHVRRRHSPDRVALAVGTRLRF